MKWARFFRDFDAKAALAVALVAFVVGILRNFGLFNDRILQAFIVTILTGLAWSVYRDRTDKAAARTEHVFPEQGHAYRQLIDYIENHDVGSAIFLQYSGQKSMDVLEAVLKKRGVTVEVFIQQKEFARRIGSARQEKLIAGAIDTFRERSKEIPNSSTFKVYEFEAPASIRAILIDDKILCLGHYTVELGRAGQQSNPDDRISVSGHDRPTMIYRSGTTQFEIFSTMVTRLADNFRQHATEIQL